ncbi:MAG: HYR domain-containing protein, partial [Flavobacteriales bacterium]
NSGANTVTLTATDAQGLTSTCTTTVTVLDTLAQVMVCQSVTVNLDASGNATITTSDVNNGSADNCSGVTLSLSQTTFTCADLGANMVTLTGTDAAGNTSTCMATVTVVDAINPIALCKPATIYLNSNGDARLVASDIDNGSTDNCSVTVTITDSIFTCADAGANNVTLTATDADGNTSTCVAVVTVMDTIAPAANCKADTLYLNASGTANLTAAMINDASSDNCTFTMSVSQSTFTCADMGVTTATLTATDASGNASTCTSAITVMDTIAPIMNCAPATVYLDAMGMATLTANQVDGGSTDNCGIVSMSVSRSSFTCADMGTRTVTLTGTDASGNTATCTTIVTVLDTVAPVVSCKSVTVALNAAGIATITTLDVDNGSADNCGITLSLSNNTFNCTNIGANTVTLTGTDASGNTASCTATVTVIDNMAPTAICQNITLNLDANGQATIVALDVDGGSFDNCAVSSLRIDKTDFDCSNLGRNQVTLTVTDLYGNVSSCTATVTVEDNVAPVVSCPADKNRTIRNTTCTYVVEDFLSETSNTDNCTANGTTTNQFPMPGEEVVVENGRVTITIITTDASMNADSCSFDVIVNCEQELDIPQFISPNGDGKNDFWDLAELAVYENNVVKIFNRYGTLVFEQRGYTNQFIGKGNVDNIAKEVLGNGLLPDGTYFYVIDLGTNSVDKKLYNGYIQIRK